MPQMNEALDRLLAAGIQGLILDLRNNGGGLLSTALQLADRFIENGPLVHVVSANNQRRTYMAEAEGTFPSMPMVVLVNQYSASASEIVAGALRDNGVAVLVGTQTFGKGSVQTVLPLRGGAGLALTTAHYETAGGHFIHGVGITPDVIVEVPDELLDTLYPSYDGGVNLDDVQLQKALEVLSDMMRARLSPAA
jgi:Periplasmic protease